MEGKKNIYETIQAVMGEIGSISKNDYNQQQHFKYRGIDAVMNALAPAFIKNHLFVVPEVLEQRREERQTVKGGNLIYSVCRVKYTFYAEDGSSIEAVVIGEGMDSGDKASNKAMSVAFKYACFQVFCIPTEEMKDPDADTPDPSEPAGRSGSGGRNDGHTNGQAGRQTGGQNHGQKQQAAQEQNGGNGVKVLPVHINTLYAELSRTGIGLKGILKNYSLTDIHEMNMDQFRNAMDILKGKPDKPIDPDTIPPEGDDGGLPWNTPGR